MAARRRVPQRTAVAGGRKDPVLRPTDNTSPWGKLTNKDPRKDYVVVQKNGMMGIAYYRGQGYNVVLADESPDAVRWAAGETVKPGEALENFGLVAMERPKSIGEEIYAAGQARADEMDEQIGKAPMSNVMGIRQSGDRERVKGHGAEGKEVYPALQME